MTQFMDSFIAPIEEEDDSHYRAWHYLKDGRELRLQIRQKVGHHFTIPYASILLVMYSAPSKISIFCNLCIFHITGVNLGELDALLQDEKVRYIQTFNAKKFEEPPEGAGKITGMTIQWTRKEIQPEEEVNQVVE